MIRFFFVCLSLLLVGVILQQWVSPFDHNLFYARFLIVPLLFFCIAHAQTYTCTLIFALIAGFLWDLEHSLAPYQVTTEQDVPSVDNLKLGYSIFLFGLLGFGIKFTQAILPYRGLLIYTLLCFVSFLLYLLLENLLLFFIRGTGTLDHQVFYQILLTSLFSSLLAPGIFLLLHKIWKKLKDRDSKVTSGFNRFLEKKFTR